MAGIVGLKCSICHNVVANVTMLQPRDHPDVDVVLNLRVTCPSCMAKQVHHDLRNPNLQPEAKKKMRSVLANIIAKMPTQNVSTCLQTRQASIN